MTMALFENTLPLTNRQQIKFNALPAAPAAKMCGTASFWNRLTLFESSGNTSKTDLPAPVMMF